MKCFKHSGLSIFPGKTNIAAIGTQQTLVVYLLNCKTQSQLLHRMKGSYYIVLSNDPKTTLKKIQVLNNRWQK
jgi:hypothetical protein